MAAIWIRYVKLSSEKHLFVTFFRKNINIIDIIGGFAYNLTFSTFSKTFLTFTQYPCSWF